ncbi:MAG: ATP synthase F1 subunit gamma [bacterium]
MASLREIRQKSKSVKSTLSVTRAMKMVAAARLAKAQGRILSARPFALRMQQLLEDIDKQTDIPGSDQQQIHPLLAEFNTNNELIVVVSGDKGLCGAFNSNVLRKALAYIKGNAGKNISVIAVGKKTRNFFRRLRFPVIKEYVNIFSRMGFVHAELIGRDVIECYLKEKLASVKIFYNSLKNAVVQDLKIEQLLPVESKRGISEKPVPEQTRNDAGVGFLYEPDCGIILETLLPRYIKAQIYRILMDSYAAELGARMTAMDSATKNALELIDILNLQFNKIRQGLITRELSELVSGAEALSA